MSVLGRFTILEKIGEGGMGYVYRAHDPRLDREVAIKVLKADSGQAERRMLREARAVARLNHPNIVTIHEVGREADQDFFVMEFLHGVPLNKWTGDWMLVVPQILDGLAAAHDAGIIHRDLKPGNILVNQTGGVKILDFGIASTMVDLDDATRTLEAVAGTPGYMAPEQLEGKSVDARADIYALGAMLYEHLTGQLPWRGPDAALLPEAWRPVILRCLQVDPNRRYASIRDLRAGLAHIPQQPERSVAVLPFVDRSPLGDQAHICDGIAEEIIHGLSRVRGLRVAARSSSFRFRGESCDLKEVGRELNVEAVLEGSVRRSGNRFRVSGQLVSCVTGFPLWSERYDSESEDLFALQDDVAAAVVQSLELRFQPAADAPPKPEVYEDMLKVRHMLRSARPGDEEITNQLITRLLREAPDNPDTYLLACGAGIMGGIWDQVSLGERLPFLESCARRVIELAPQRADGYFVLANLRIFGAFDLEEGRTLARRAETLGFSSTQFEAAYHTYFALGDLAGAEQNFRFAASREPHSSQVFIGLAQCAFFRGNGAGMAAEARRGLALEPGNEVLEMIAAIGDLLQDASMDALARLRAIWERTQVADFAGHYSYGLFHLGRASEIEPVYQWALQQAVRRRVNPLAMARLCSYTGRQQESLTWLERAIRDRSTFLYLLPYYRMERVMQAAGAASVLAPLPKSWWPDAGMPAWGPPRQD